MSYVFLYAVRTDAIIPTWLFDNSQFAETALTTGKSVSEVMDPRTRIASSVQNSVKDASKTDDGDVSDDRKCIECPK